LISHGFAVAFVYKKNGRAPAKCVAVFILSFKSNTVHLRGHSRVLLAGIHFRKRLWMPD
jgi:hypothetical protein